MVYRHGRLKVIVAGESSFLMSPKTRETLHSCSCMTGSDLTTLYIWASHKRGGIRSTRVHSNFHDGRCQALLGQELSSLILSIPTNYSKQEIRKHPLDVH